MKVSVRNSTAQNRKRMLVRNRIDSSFLTDSLNPMLVLDGIECTFRSDSLNLRFSKTIESVRSRIQVKIVGELLTSIWFGFHCRLAKDIR
jgi:hypothetical protein